MVWNTVITIVLLLVSAASTVAVFGTNAFTWRGNVLKLKDVVQISSEGAPFKLDTTETSLNPPLTSDVQAAETDVKGYPLLPEAKPTFPGHRQIVFSNEMKFRELMSDAQSAYSNELIRCYVDESGGIERIGLKCRVIESKSLKNGQAMYVIEPLNKIRIDGMTVKQGRSYLSSTKTLELEEEMITQEEINTNEQLCISLFTQLKSYLRAIKMRLAHEMSNRDLAESDFDLSFICLTPALIASRPGQADFPTNSPAVNIERHNNFSYSIGNLLSAPPQLSHLLLVSNTFGRLTSLSSIVKLAATETKVQISQLAQASIDEPGTMDLIQKVLELEISGSDGSYEDLLPPSDWKDLHIDNVEFEGDDEDGYQVVGEETDDDVMQ